MAIPAGVILIWTGTHASIPNGWSRETSLDDKFPKSCSDAVAPNQTGGANTHTHTDGGHTHTLNSHTHTYATGNSGTFGDSSYSGTNGGNVSGNHNHSSGISSAVSGGTLSDTVSWASVNQEPPFYTVIFIKPTSTPTPIKAGIITHYNGATVPAGFNYCDGENSTPDLRNKYLKGASTGADAGTTGGGLTHQHTITHNHSAVNHTHTGGLGAYSGDGIQSSDGNNEGLLRTDHTHTATLNATASSVSDYTKTDAGSGDTVEPAHKKLGVIKCVTPSMKLGMVGLWLGSIEDIPKNWVLCDGNNDTLDLRDKFVKIGATLANNDENGGSHTHTHTGIAHTHTSTGTHTHTGQTGAGNITIPRHPSNSGALFAWTGHVHTLSSIQAVTSVYANGTSTPNTVNNEPVYRTAAYIQLIKLEMGGAGLLSMIF